VDASGEFSDGVIESVDVGGEQLRGEIVREFPSQMRGNGGVEARDETVKDALFDALFVGRGEGGNEIEIVIHKTIFIVNSFPNTGRGGS